MPWGVTICHPPRRGINSPLLYGIYLQVLSSSHASTTMGVLYEGLVRLKLCNLQETMWW
jgi:hypothetical protein